MKALCPFIFALALGALICSIAFGAIVVPVKHWWLVWDYPAHDADITFNVYSTTNFTDWVLRTNVQDQTCPFVMDQPAEFFHVTAYNTSTGEESL